jgi:D-psicose/D-tagatose/L-ribulose 3-epimerase
MKLGISNLAWGVNETEHVIKQLIKHDINNIECVLSKIKPWSDLTSEDIINYKSMLEYLTIKPYSIQSLFYGINCESIEDSKTVSNHFIKVIDYAKVLDAKILVFGSPKLRKKYIGWEKDLITIFKDVDAMLNDSDLTLVIEPNSSTYGGQFFTSIPEIVEFIDSNKLKNIRTMIDTHNLILENQNPSTMFLTYYEYIKHIHISEENLAPIISNEMHYSFSEVLNNLKYKDVITYEVLNHCDLFSSIITFSNIYGK